MARVIIVGDGPAGLSAALFLARADHEVVLFAQNATALHYALLHNYLGIPEMAGTAFQRIALDQVADAGAEIREAEVTAARVEGDGVVVEVADAGVERADHLILAGGKPAQRLADEVGAERSGGKVVIDPEYRTTVDRVYAVGRVARPNRSQAIISAGAGATAALDIMAREAGRDVTDWDSPPDSD
ncbi:MAG TPA: FAD-dependent oxidoreductase [Egibacteraceae bacterium]|nr:FAD-dependent oxidoreductase [Egibacteraceae bacterium]